METLCPVSPSRGLQYAFNQCYARGAVDCAVPPDPPVRPELAHWLAGCLERRRSGAGA